METGLSQNLTIKSNDDKTHQEAQPRLFWDTESLIVVGLFTALVRVSSLAVALLGGGMNPVSLLLRNALATALLIVMVSRVRRFGTLMLYTVVGQAISFLIRGDVMIVLLPGYIAGALLSDLVIHAFGGYKKLWTVIFGVILYDFWGRIISLAFMYAGVRENPAMFAFGAGVVALGYTGCLVLGVPLGAKLVKELRHAGIIREI